MVVAPGQLVTLDGSQSLTDTGDVCYPTPRLSSLTYTWEQLGGASVTLTASTEIATFTTPSAASKTEVSQAI